MLAAEAPGAPWCRKEGQDMESLTYIDGDWVDGNPFLLRANSHAAWLSSIVFDGARAFRGMAPDLDLHCQRVVDSAHAFTLKPTLTGPEIDALAREGIRQFPKDAELYVRPMYWAEGGFVIPDPDSTRFALVINASPIPEPKGFSVCLSSYRRPAASSAPTDAKASCLYPNAARALIEARDKGFDNSVVLDLLGNVAELATANLFIVKAGVAITPIANGTFLNGITRQRVIKLLRDAGVRVEERVVSWPEVLDADEIFSTGNYAKVSPINRIEDRDLQPGPIGRKAYDLYFEYARQQAV